MIPQTDLFFPENFSTAHYDAAITRLTPTLAQIESDMQSNRLPILSVAARSDDLMALRPLAQKFRGFRDIVILGTGGSSLGAKSLYSLVDCGFGPPSGTPKLHFMDNVDPHRFASLLRSIDPAQTGILAISKSGSTAETLCQFHIAANWIGADRCRSQLIVITEPGGNILRGLAESLGAIILDHDPKIGGRFSVLSNVGLLPALIAGIDAEAVRGGASAILRENLQSSNGGSAVRGAAMAATLNRHHHVSQCVLMAYCDRLTVFVDWYKQLWAESLGKNGIGITPVGAIGTVDQHSQLQLYLAGPRDKFLTLIGVAADESTLLVNSIGRKDDRLHYMYGRGMGALFNAEFDATVTSMRNQSLPLRVMRFDKLDAAAMGGLLMHFMLETILTAELLGVNPYDQPAVEEGKALTREFMAKRRA